ncbi:MAG: hypothetical protein V2A73_20090 [Pseudomonadota bacterium]
MRKLLSELLGQFSKDELALIEEYSVENLDEAVVDAENQYREASDKNRHEAEAYYNLVLNLVAKFALPVPRSRAGQFRADSAGFGRFVTKTRPVAVTSDTARLWGVRLESC